MTGPPTCSRRCRSGRHRVPRTAHRRRRPGVLQDHRPVRSPLAGHPRRAGQPVSPQGTGDSRLARSPTTSPPAPALDPHLELMAQPRAAMVQGTHRSARRRGTFTSVPALIEAIQTWVTRRNQDPKPFICRAAAGETPEKVRRGRRPLSQVKSTTQHQSTDGSEGPAALRFGVPIVRSSTRLAVRPVMLRRPG